MPDDHTIRLQSDEQLDTVNEQLRLIRRKNGLTFGTDAYLLAAFVRSQPRERAVDLGSGTGILSLLLCARNKVRSVIAAEVQPVFAELTERNAALNGMADRIRVFAGDVRTLGLRDTDGEVGLVLSNPPYLRAGSGRPNRETEKEIARHEVAGGIADFCAAAGRVLRTGGRFCVVWKPERLRELFSAMENQGKIIGAIAIAAGAALIGRIIYDFKKIRELTKEDKLAGEPEEATETPVETAEPEVAETEAEAPVEEAVEAPAEAPAETTEDAKAE